MRFDPDSRFFQFCSRLVELVTINILWLACCLPIFTIGASTTAMHTCLYAWRAQEPCGSKVFFATFRKQFAKATVLWLGMLVMGAFLTLDYSIVAYLSFPGRMGIIGLICFLGFALVLVAGMAFPLLSQFPMGIKDTLINAVLLCLAHLPKMLLVTAANLLPVALGILLPKVMVFTGFAWLLCGFALLALYDIRVLERVFAPFRKTDGEQNGT